MRLFRAGVSGGMNSFRSPSGRGPYSTVSLAALCFLLLVSGRVRGQTAGLSDFLHKADPLSFETLEGPPELTEKLRNDMVAGALDPGAKEALSVLQSVVDDPNASPSQSAYALIKCAGIFGQQNLPEKATQAFERAATGKATPSLRALALADLAAWQGGRRQKAEALSSVNKALEIPGVPLRLLSAILVERALILDDAGRTEEAVRDCITAFENTEALPAVRLMALQKRLEFFTKTGKQKEALADMGKALLTKDLPPDWRAGILVSRGSLLMNMGRMEAAEKDATEVAEKLPGVSPALRGKGFYNRAGQALKAGNPDKALEDYQRVIDLKGAEPLEVSTSLLARAGIFQKREWSGRVIDELTEVIRLKGAPVEYLAQAYVARAKEQMKRGLYTDAMEDYSTVIGMKGAPVEQVGHALFGRGQYLKDQGEREPMKVDFERLISLEGARIEHRASACMLLAFAEEEKGNREKALKDIQRGLNFSEAPAFIREGALMFRAALYGEMNNADGALADVEALLKLPGVSAEKKAQALSLRFDIFKNKLKKGEDELMPVINDILALPEAPAKYRMAALTERAKWYDNHQQPEKAAADRKAAEAISNGP